MVVQAVMHISRRAVGVLFLAMLCCATAAAAAQQQQRAAVVDGLPETVPLTLLLGNTKYRNAQLDTAGSYVAFIQPDDNGVNNIFVQKLPTGPQLAALKPNVSLLEQRSSAERQVTFDNKRGVTAYSWAEDNSTIFYLQDSGGDENFHLYMATINRLYDGSSSSSSKGGSSSSSSSGNSSSQGTSVDLTPFPGVKVQGIITSERVPDRIYFSMNKRDPTVFDLYTLDMNTMAIQLHTVNPGPVSMWLVDYDFELRGVENYDSSDGSTYVQINDNLSKSSSSSSKPAIQAEKAPATSKGSSSSSSSSQLPAMFAAAAAGNWTLQQWIAASSTGSDLTKWRRLISWPFGEEGGMFRFNQRGDGLYGLTSTDRDATEFVLFSSAPGAKILKRLASSPNANVGAVVFNPKTWEPQMVSFNYLRPQWTFLEPSLEDFWQKLQSLHPNRDPSIVSRTYDSKTWIVSYNADNATTAQYLYRVGTWPPQLLMEMQPGLKKYQMANMHSVVITARDGLKLPAYLILPFKANIPAVLPACAIGDVPDLKPEVKKASADSPLKCPLNLKLPLVLFVHGGPWSRDTWGADSIVQFLANRGYAVLQVNYRGSTGYGKRFYNLGNRQWGVGTMQHDLSDSVRWAIEKGIADPARICIFGGSYGGYATLAGLAFTPELYACGVDLVGVSNVATFLKSIPPYWKPLRIDFVNRVGDAQANSTLNQEISPLFHVRNIRAPLMMGQGANDPRVPKAESDQMFQAMKQKGLDVEYVLYPDEGHGLVRPDNRLDFYSRVEQFLSKHLGGRAEPLLKLAGSSAQVVTKV